LKFKGGLIDNELWQILVKDQGIGFDKKTSTKFSVPLKDYMELISIKESVWGWLSAKTSWRAIKELSPQKANSVTEPVSYLPCQQKPLLKS